MAAGVHAPPGDDVIETAPETVHSVHSTESVAMPGAVSTGDDHEQFETLNGCLHSDLPKFRTIL